MKIKIKMLSALLFFTFQFSIFNVSGQATSPSVDSVKTDIIEMDSTVQIRTTQVTSVTVSSERIAQEIEKFKSKEAELEGQLKQLRAQRQDFERLLGGVIVTENRIKEKKGKEKTSKNLHPATVMKPSDGKKK